MVQSEVARGRVDARMCRCATPTDQEFERAQDHHLGRRASVSESDRALYGKKPGDGQAFARPSPGSTRPSSCSWCEERRVCRGAKQTISTGQLTRLPNGSASLRSDASSFPNAGKSSDWAPADWAR